MSNSARFQSFKEFYPYYLNEHQDVTCRRLHFIGTSLALGFLSWVIATGTWAALPLFLVIGYGFAWVGHFFFEKNKPATFKYPLWSFIGDFCMWFDILRGKVSLKN